MSKSLAWLTVAATVALATFPSQTTSAVAAVVGPPKVAWKDLTYDQQRAFMKAVVVPKMTTVFKAFDPKKFKKVTCITCHGEDGLEREYKMPGNDITPLPGTPEAFMARVKKEPTWPKWTQFMSEKVEPAMGVLLNLPVFDPKKPVKGAFSCNACHKLEGAPAKP